jgi:hypothetical protein
MGHAMLPHKIIPILINTRVTKQDKNLTSGIVGSTKEKPNMECNFCESGMQLCTNEWMIYQHQHASHSRSGG